MSNDLSRLAALGRKHNMEYIGAYAQVRCTKAGEWKIITNAYRPCLQAKKNHPYEVHVFAPNHESASVQFYNYAMALEYHDKVANLFEEAINV